MVQTNWLKVYSRFEANWKWNIYSKQRSSPKKNDLDIKYLAEIVLCNY
jgi:hypothetical protein